MCSDMVSVRVFGERVAGGSGKHSFCLFAFRKWNLLATVLSSSQNECVLLIIWVLCDSPRAAVWPRTGLWFGRPPHSPLRLQINHWNLRDFSRLVLLHCVVFYPVTSAAVQHPRFFIQDRLVLPYLWEHMIEAWHGMCVYVVKKGT